MKHQSDDAITRISTKRLGVQASLNNDERVGSDDNNSKEVPRVILVRI